MEFSRESVLLLNQLHNNNTEFLHNNDAEFGWWVVVVALPIGHSQLLLRSSWAVIITQIVTLVSVIVFQKVVQQETEFKVMSFIYFSNVLFKT
jgi:hypothetical protein